MVHSQDCADRSYHSAAGSLKGSQLNIGLAAPAAEQLETVPESCECTAVPKVYRSAEQRTNIVIELYVEFCRQSSVTAWPPCEFDAMALKQTQAAERQRPWQ